MKYISAVLAAVIAFLLCAFPASAITYTIGDHEYYDLPTNHLSEYPPTLEGYAAFYRDYVNVVLYNYAEYKGVYDIAENWNDVTTYFFGDDAPQVEVPDPRQIFSNYYLGGGSPTVSGPPSWSDGHGGSFYWDVQEYGGYRWDCSLYYKKASGEVIYVSGVTTYQYPESLSVEVYGTDDPNIVNVIGYMGDTKYVDCMFDMGEPGEPKEKRDRVPVCGSAFGKHGHIFKDPETGDLYFVDDNGNMYKFNPDGTLTNPDDGLPYYFTPDPDSLDDDALRDLQNDLNLYCLLMFTTLNHMSTDPSGSTGTGTPGTGNKDSKGCNCAVYLAYIAQKCNSIDLRTKDMLEVLKQIEKNTRKEDKELDLVLPEDEDIQIELLSDAILKKFDFSQYYKVLDRLLGLCFGAEYHSDIDFDKYFDLDSYMPSDDSNSFSLEPSRYLRGDTYDLAVNDAADTSGEDVSNASISAGLTMPPEINIEFYGESYNLFGWMTPEYYDVVRVLKEFIRLVITVKFYFWLIKFLPCLLTGNDVANVATEVMWYEGEFS